MNTRKGTAGYGAGVTVNITVSVDWEYNGEKVLFKPAMADVEFESAMDTKKASKGLKIQLSDIIDEDDIASFLYRFGSRDGEDDSGTVSLNTKLMDPDSQHRKLILSGGYIRSTMEKGDAFDFSAEADSEYGVYLNGAAIFTQEGQYAWEDLDNYEEED